MKIKLKIMILRIRLSLFLHILKINYTNGRRFLNNDLRTYIFSYLRKHPKKQCQDCVAYVYGINTSNHIKS